ncbi:hypothetical protein Hanom_Chr12g01145171 [Helianthus anomalus]
MGTFHYPLAGWDNCKFIDYFSKETSCKLCPGLCHRKLLALKNGCKRLSLFKSSEVNK